MGSIPTTKGYAYFGLHRELRPTKIESMDYFLPLAMSHHRKRALQLV